MKTPRLVIIDDGIHSSSIPSGQAFESYVVGENGVKQGEPENQDTHAFACYRVFKRFVDAPYHLISIKVMDHETGTGSKNSLLSALRWCAKQDIDLISMSMGTRQYLDFAHISEAVNALQNTIIVAACSNQNTLTFPACLPTVIGVRHCPEIALKGKFAYIHAPYDQIEMMTYVKNASNSSAAPIIAARVCGYLANGFSSLKIIRQKLKEDAVQDTSFVNYQFYKSLLPEWEEVQVPVVALPDDIPKGIDKLKPLVTAFVQDGYRVAVLSQSHKTCVTDHVFHLSWQLGQIPLPDLIELYHNFTLPDILFLHTKGEEVMPDGINADITIEPHWLDEDVQCLFAKIKEMLS